MTLLPAGVKVHLAFGYIDMRKGINGSTSSGDVALSPHYGANATRGP